MYACGLTATARLREARCSCPSGSRELVDGEGSEPLPSSGPAQSVGVILVAPHRRRKVAGVSLTSRLVWVSATLYGDGVRRRCDHAVPPSANGIARHAVPPSAAAERPRRRTDLPCSPSVARLPRFCTTRGQPSGIGGSRPHPPWPPYPRCGFAAKRAWHSLFPPLPLWGCGLAPVPPDAASPRSERGSPFPPLPLWGCLAPVPADAASPRSERGDSYSRTVS